MAQDDYTPEEQAEYEALNTWYAKQEYAIFKAKDKALNALQAEFEREYVKFLEGVAKRKAREKVSESE